MKLQIVLHPNPLLKKKSTKVDNVSAVQKLCSDMIETMEEEKGIGLSAVQVGELKRVVAIHQDTDKSLDGHLIMINPKIFSLSRETEKGEEGCLSFPKIFRVVERSKKIKVRYADSSGQKQKLKATGLLARVIQHEVDHLDGVLFIDRADGPIIIPPRTVERNAQ